jgi:hypothetical protein
MARRKEAYFLLHDIFVQIPSGQSLVWYSGCGVQRMAYQQAGFFLALMGLLRTRLRGKLVFQVFE